MSTAPFSVPYESQVDPQTNRGCGAASLSMVYKSFGKDVPQAAIWPLIAKPNRLGSVASTTHLMALHALSQGLNAVIIQARHPLQVLRLCRETGIRAILNLRLQPGVATGHFAVLVDIDDKNVVLHDPFLGAFRTIPLAELTRLWQASAPVSEIVGNVLIGISAEPLLVPVCEYCHTAMPTKIDCPRCHKAVGLSPSAVLGCLRDGCIARMWNFVCCPSCDYLFNETSKPAGDAPGAPASGDMASSVPGPQNLDKVFAELERFCNHVLTIKGAADHADLKAQLAILQSGKERLKAAQLENLGYFQAHTDRLASLVQDSQQKVEAHRMKVEELNKPLPPLDGNALGQALLKNLGFS